MGKFFSKWLAGCRWPGWFLAGSLVFQLPARADQIIYDDALQNGWADWGWATHNYTNNSPVYSGTKSVSVTCGGYTALYIHHDAFAAGQYTNLTFRVNGGSSGGQVLTVEATLSQVNQQPGYVLPALAANTWQQFNVPLPALGVTNQSDMDGIWIYNNSGASLATFYLDDIVLVTNGLPAVTNVAVTITVDAQLNRHAISPLIYGAAFASSNQVKDLNFTVNRSGGNSETRYNWQLNAHNRAADWYFESIDDGDATPGASADDFVSNSRNGGAQAMITIPMIGWLPRLGAGRGKLASYSIAKYGPQTGNDWQWYADAGNGVGTNSTTHTHWLITTNDPNDANFLTNSVFQQAYVRHLTNRWGSATNGGVRYYLMDNEHSIWFATHQDVHPVGPTMQEIRDKIFDYASMVKANDPNALVCAPEEWGWSGYFYSGYDQQNSGMQDRASNGGWDYMPWLLNQIHQHDTNAGQRLLDYFTLHCYPQENGVGGNSASSATVLLRNQSTRQLWDTNYTDPSWINSVIALIPRMKSWVATNYPGTKTGITEYNWGAEADISGATAQADLLGIFGREGLDLATRWTTPDMTTPTYLAMKMYRNYDGNKSIFGDTSVSATGPNPDQVSTFAAVRSVDGALTVMVINKQPAVSATLTMNLTNFSASGPARVWQLTSANIINHLADAPLTNGILNPTVPAQSITLFVLPGTITFHLRTGTNPPAGPLELWLDGQAGQSYILQSSTDLVHWVAVSTNTPASNSFRVMMTMTNLQMFYRGLLSQ